MPQDLLLFMMVLSAVTLVPGPNVIVVVRNALSGGLPSGVQTIFGNLIALLTMASLAAFGLGSLFLIYPQSLVVLKVLGAIYLIYIASKLLRSGLATLGKPKGDFMADLPAPHGAAIKDGLLISFSNPKAILFLMSVFPQHIDPTGDRLRQFLILFIVLAAIVFSIHFAYAAIGALLRKSKRFHTILAVTNLVAAALLLVFAVTVLAT